MKDMITIWLSIVGKDGLMPVFYFNGESWCQKTSVSIVAADAMVLKHQDISSRSIMKIYIEPSFHHWNT